MHVVLDHAVRVFILPGDTAQFLFNVGAEMHTCSAPPDKPGLTGFMLFLNEFNRTV